MDTKTKLIFLSLLMAGFILPLMAVFPGNCLNFENGDYATGTGIPTSLTAVTLEGWVNHSDLSGSYQRYLTIGNENAVIRFNGGTQLHFYIKNSAGSLIAITANVLTTSEWLHVAGTYDGTTMKLYLNGNQVATTTPATGGFYSCDGSFALSRSNEAMHGKMDDFRFWTVARTQTQIRDNRYVQLSGSETGLRSYWRMDSSSGTTITDDKGYSNATMYNMTNANWVASTVPFFSQTKGYAFNSGTNRYANLKMRTGLPIYNNGTANAYSISMWIKGAQQGGMCFFSESSSTSENPSFQMKCAANGKMSLYIYNDVGANVAARISSSVVFDNTWHHIAWVDNNGTATLYVDGVGDATNFNYTRGTLTLDTTTLGSQYEAGYGGFNEFTGQMDEIRIWNIALNSTQVDQSMVYATGNTVSGMVAFFQANEGSGKVAYDVCNGNNAIFDYDNTNNWTASTAPVGYLASGTISSNTAWQGTNIYVTGDITINNGVTLTLDPGMTVKFNGFYKISVQGRLLAVGTAADSIRFTSTRTAKWNGIRFATTPATNDSSKFVYCVFTNAKAGTTNPDYNGSALYVNTYNKVLVKNSSFRSCTNPSSSGAGGVMYLYDADILVQNTDFSGNSSSSTGGAVYSYSTSTLFEQCRFQGNSATGNGGAIYGDNTTIGVKKCIFKNNSSANGGAIEIAASTGWSQSGIHNSIFDGNSASNDGGAISLKNSSNTTDVSNCTIINNSAGNGGGLYLQGGSGARFDIRNDVIWGNTATNGASIRIGSATTANIIYTDLQGNISGISIAGGASLSGDQTGTFAMDPSVSYSSSNPGTGYLLGNLSPCINAGDPSTKYSGSELIDINGNPRFYNNTLYTGNLNTALDKIDIGAIEDQNGALIIPTGTTMEQNYTINSDLYLYTGKTMTVNAGVTLSFAATAHANINGNLTAVGTAANPILFTESVPNAGWLGITFSSTGSAPYPTSRMEFCTIEKGRGDTGNEAWGGNVHAWYYNSLIMKNCHIRYGVADVGGALYARRSDVSLIGCLITENVCTTRGTGVYFNESTTKLVNCTIANNSKNGTQTPTSALACIYMTATQLGQPQITSSIIRNNGNTPLYWENDTPFTNVKHCNVEGGYNGTGNISTDPCFTGGSSHPYNISPWSFCLNTGIADTTGFSLPATDLYGNPRIYSHTNTSYNRLDMGAYEYQGYHAPANMTATDGNSDYPGYVYICWDHNSAYNIPPTGFRVFRNGNNLETVDGTTFSYNDYNVIPGEIYTYYVQSYYNSETGNSCNDTGYLKPNGIISGNIKTTNNNPVMGVEVTLSPSNGNCLYLNATNNAYISIPNPLVNMNQSFTLEVWVKTSSQNVNLINTNNHYLQINSSGRVVYTDGLHTLTQQDTSVNLNDGDWHHIAIVSDVSSGKVLMYMDDIIAAQNETFTFANYTQAGFSVPVGITGYIDDIRIWSAVRDSSDIAENMFIVVPYNADGLKGYWALNEGTGTSVYDATNYSHNGTSTNCTWSSADPGMAYGALTDAWGDFIITQIAYGNFTTFTVRPSKEGHMFQPEQRLVTLSSSNIAVNNVDFSDNSMIPISGYVKFQGTIVPVVGAIVQLNGENALPLVTTDDDGYYVLEVEHGSACQVSMNYKGHNFNRTWNLGNVTYPRPNINFEDVFKTEYRLEVAGGKESYPIGDFNVTMASVNGLYTREITGQSWPDGYINIFNVVPLDYNVTVNPGTNDPFNLVIDDQFQSNKTKHFDQIDADSEADTLRFEWRAPLQVEVSWPDSLVLKHFPDYPESEFYVVNQNEWVDIVVQAFEDYSYEEHPDQRTYLSDCDIHILDEIGPENDPIDDNFNGETYYTYTFAPYLPNLLEGGNRSYQNMLEIEVYDENTDRHAIQTDWAITQGIRGTENNFATTSPEIPFLILHDPPGDASFSSFSRSSTHSTNIQVSYPRTYNHDANFTAHMGPDCVMNHGIVYSVQTEVNFTMDLSYGFNYSHTQTNGNTSVITLTTSEEYRTSEDSQLIGRESDLYIGGALNLIWGMTKDLSWHEDTQSVEIMDDVQVIPNGFDTVYMYTEKQIQLTVIPNLIAIGDTVSANRWQSFIEQNTDNIDHAVANTNHPGNVSFNAGASYTYSETNSSEKTVSTSYETTVSHEAGVQLGIVVNGMGAEGGYKFNTTITTSGGTDTTEGNETTISYSLADDDETSSLNYVSDNFTVDIKKDPVYGTPVFEVLGGASSCRWEPNTLPRDGVSFSANTYTASNLASDQQAVFVLNLGNTTQNNEDRRYYLTLHHESNPTGAIVLINGLPLVERMPFDIGPGQQVQVVMTVAQGPLSHECEDLTLEFYAEGDRGNNGPDGHYFYIYKSFDIYWESPYSRVAISYPQDGWLINQALDDSLNIVFRDYDLSKPNFKSIKLEYKHPEASDWLPAFEVTRDSLEAHPVTYTAPWDVSSLSDGIYEIRAATTDYIQSNWYTAILTGVIDRSSPVTWGLPQPADGILQLGDVISLSFNENIDPNSIQPGRVEMVEVGGQFVVDCNVQCYGNTISIVPRLSNYWMENKTLRVNVHDLTDVYGNPMEGETVWEFYVNSNPVCWQTPKVEMIKPLAQTTTFTAVLVNTGGQISSFDLTDLSGWLNASPMSGTLMPLDNETITFTVSSQLGFGTFRDTLYAEIPGLGKEPLIVVVKVLANPPEWTTKVNYNQYNTMTITGQMVIDEAVSEDENDIIGAFMLNGSGEYECRGVAQTEYNDYLGGSYRFFLTIYSDEDSGENIQFRVWDASQCKDHFGIIETYTFQAEAVYGTPAEPDIVHASNQLVKDITLSRGWNWISTNLLNANMQVNSFLASLSPTSNDLIKSQTQYSQYVSGTGWVGSLSDIATTKTYKIKLNAADNLTLTGVLQDPDLSVIEYSTGWNWISYIPHVSISVGEAFGNAYNLTNGDMVKSQRGYAQYISGYGWVGSLRFMNPGEGYMLKTANTGTFYYPDYHLTRSWERYHEPEPIARVDGWNLDPMAYEYSANLTGVVQLNGLPIGLNNVLGAFVGNQCRGIAEAMEVMGTNMYFLTLYANTLNETLSFKVYNTITHTTVDLPVTLPFVNNQIIGNPILPYIFTMPLVTLDSPKNLKISWVDNRPLLNWDAVWGAQSYNVYRSDDPNAALPNWVKVATGVITTSWMDNSISGAYFYRVTAVAGSSRDKIETPEKPQEIINDLNIKTKPDEISPILRRKP